MTFEPFHCTFVGDSRGFKVTPEEGTLNRRGGDPQELDVSYKGNVSMVHLRGLVPAHATPVFVLLRWCCKVLGLLLVDCCFVGILQT